MKPFFLSSLCIVLFWSLSPTLVFGERPVAKVGDKTITLEELQKTLRSSPYGNPQVALDPLDENNILKKLLMELINAELFFGDAMNSKIVAEGNYKNAIASYSESLLAELYRKYLDNEKIDISDEEIEKLAKEKSLTKEVALSILRTDARKKLLAAEGVRLFDKYKVTYSKTFTTRSVSELRDDDILVSSKIFEIRYRDIKHDFASFGSLKGDMLDMLSQLIEKKLFAETAKEMRMDSTEEYRDFIDEYAKSIAINMHKEHLRLKYSPSDEEVHQYINQTTYLKYLPQLAEVLMIVVPTEKEATEIRNQLLAGANFYELAMEHSIAPNAKVNAGKVGTIRIGDRPYTTFDIELLSLAPGEISKPLKGSKGYSIFRMIGITERRPRNKADMYNSAKEAIIDFKLQKHLDSLRRDAKVEIYPPGSTN